MTVPVSRLHTAPRSADRRSSAHVTLKTAVVTCRIWVWFTERFDTHDLKEAKALLAALA